MEIKKGGIKTQAMEKYVATKKGGNQKGGN